MTKEADIFRKDIIPITDDENITEEEWKKFCPGYGKGYKNLNGLYCDHCFYLYDENGKICPNNK